MHRRCRHAPLDQVTEDAAIADGDWALAGFDLAMIGFGAMLACCAWRVQHWQPPPSAAQRKRRQHGAGEEARA